MICSCSWWVRLQFNMMTHQVTLVINEQEYTVKIKEILDVIINDKNVLNLNMCREEYWKKHNHLYFYNYIKKRYTASFGQGIRLYLRKYTKSTSVQKTSTLLSDIIGENGLLVAAKCTRSYWAKAKHLYFYNYIIKKYNKTFAEGLKIYFKSRSNHVFVSPKYRKKIKIVDILKDIRDVNGGIKPSMSSIRFWKCSRHLYFYNYIIKKYGFTFGEGLRYFLDGYKEPNKCNCGNPMKLRASHCSVKCATKDELVTEKKVSTRVSGYGTTSISKHIINAQYVNDADFIKQQFLTEDDFVNFEEMTKFFNIGIETCYRFMRRLDITYKIPPRLSTYELEIINFIKSISDTEIVQLYRDKLEIDIYLPAFNLGIEFNGLIWHSYHPGTFPCFDTPEYVVKNRHVDKTNYFEERGIQILQIFENEWDEKKEIWKGVIKSKLRLNERIFARNCELRELKNKDVSEFLKENHLQGYIQSSISIGLFYKDELISVMTFSKSRFNTSYDYELIRFCTKSGFTVVGAASKLLSYFRSKYEGTIISYANRRWSNGNVYENLGFELKNTSKPNYFYFLNKSKMYSRNEFQKHKLKDKLSVFDESLSEVQNMYNNGFRRIWDSGNKVYVLK